MLSGMFLLKYANVLLISKLALILTYYYKC